MNRKWKIALKAMSSVMFAILILLAVLLVGVRIFGVQILTILSPSMEPKYPTGSLVYISVFTVKNGQTLTIEGGEFVINFGANGTDYATGNVQNNLFDVQAGGKLVINDGTFTATMVEDGYNLIPVIIDNNGEVEINGGSFSTNAINLFRNRNGKMTINDGTFTGVQNPLNRTNYPYTVIWNQYANSNLIVKGGTFTNIEVEKEAGSVEIAVDIDLPLWVPVSER